MTKILGIISVGGSFLDAPVDAAQAFLFGRTHDGLPDAGGFDFGGGDFLPHFATPVTMKAVSGKGE